MIVHDVDELRKTDRQVVTENWQSTRLIVKSDGLGYSVHHTIVPEGSEVHCHYQQHFETNYVIAGEGEVFHVESGKTVPIAVGTVYALDKHDEHVLRATKGDLHLVCVFNPPITGKEVHNETGGYDLA
jgi:L-ectoine synthase